MFYNRDLSWLGFNLRVLQEAADENVPVYERLKFLSIFSSNLDEFFRVRYPYIIAFSQLNRKIQLQLSTGLSEDLPVKIQGEINRQLDIFGNILKQHVIPLLKENGIIFYYNEPVRKEHIPEIKELFLSQVLSFIQPLFLDSNVKQQFLPANNKLYLVVSLKNAQGNGLQHAVVNIPSDKLQRFFVLTPYEGSQYVIFIDDIIRQNLNCIFPRAEIEGVYAIKFNRDAELRLDDEYSGNLLQKIEKQLTKRAFGPPSRFLYELTMPRNVQLFLSSAFGLRFEEMFAGDHYHNLSDLASFPHFDEKLHYEKWKPLSLPGLLDCGDIFHVLNSKDILLHIPYQSYNPVLSFFNQAAVDADVTHIYITLYRVAADSHIVNALISAAKNGKKVIAFIELKARFDEANNIRWSREMKDAGIKLIYSLPGIKVHSKIGIIRKKSGAQTLSYAILSTGNFNETTAQYYTDHVLMTTDPFIIKELLELFRCLQKKNIVELRNKAKFEKLLVSQFNMIERFEKLIDAEIQKAQLGEEAMIRIKVNNLEEPHMINYLYKASQEGVKVHLIVRSICCLMPGIPGISDNITVKRLVDRYLEHTRLFIFGTGDKAEVIMGSADWMNRNLHQRIEVCVSINNISCKKELIDYFDFQWSDTEKAVELSPNLEHRFPGDGEKNINSQRSIYQYLKQIT